ncbi:MAG: polymer-forming cytoskeletal protein, partial [Burkholderiales bacterium]
MFGMSKKADHGILIKNLETIIGKSVRITGDIQVSNGIRIDGHLDGNITQEDGHSATIA